MASGYSERPVAAARRTVESLDKGSSSDPGAKGTIRVGQMPDRPGAQRPLDGYLEGVVNRVLDRDEFRRQADRAMLVLYASVVESLGWATVALLDQDVELAERVISDDRQVDDRAGDLIGLIKDRLSEATVEPDELEDLIALLQIVPELERSADLAEHIAQRARQGLGGSISPRARGLIQSMCDVGIRMWQLSSRAYAERSRDLSFEINEADDELDNLSANLLREGAAGGVEPAVAAEVALLARFYERLGDHAVNLSRRSAAMVTPRRLSPLQALRRRWDADGDRAARLHESLLAWTRGIRLIPRDSFFELFRGLATNARLCGSAVLEMVNDCTRLEDHYAEIRRLERQGDEMTVEVQRRLDAAFLTPYGRGDIHALAEALDDVLDRMLAAGTVIHTLAMDTSLPEVKQQAENLAQMGVELDHLIGCLQSKQGARRRLERIEGLEREGDAIHRRSMTRLFSGDYEALEVLKWRDIVQALEDAMNQIEHASDVVESILVKRG
jgi:predicted phosphate transport protein (TIGR00153 family)